MTLVSITIDTKEVIEELEDQGILSWDESDVADYVQQNADSIKQAVLNAVVSEIL